MAEFYLQNKLQLLAWGDAGYVYKVTDYIVLKCSKTKHDPRISTENAVFELLERRPRPNIVRSFLRLPDLNFMEYLPGVKGKEPEHLIRRWMAELSNAAAWLESLGLAHSDIRPPNLLLDASDHLKVTDFDNTAKIGDEVDVGTAPYARLLGMEAEEDCGTFGYLGARTEQFAIGSVYYYMTHGYEPYDNERYADHGPTVLDMLQRMQFPEIKCDNQNCATIRRCWHGEFTSVKELANVLLTKSRDRSKSLSAEVYQARYKECEKLIRDGLLDVYTKQMPRPE